MTPLRRSLAGAFVLFFVCACARAGMPSALPLDYAYVWKLTDSTQARVEAISFFLVALVVATAVFRWVWNSLQVQFPRLPRISFPRALGLIFLWGLLAIVVLTMISGARELMTPGAWEKQGLTYKVEARKEEPPAAKQSFSISERKAALVKLKAALWAYAAEHNDRFPASADEIEPQDLWSIPGAPKLRFIYVPGSKPGAAKAPFLVYEPDIECDERLTLTPNGDIRAMTTGEFNKWRYPQLDR
jgi:hypothetical protein